MNDLELNILFAEKWLEREVDREHLGTKREPMLKDPRSTPGFESWSALPDFVNSVATMVRILEKSGLSVRIERVASGWSVDVYGGMIPGNGNGGGETLSRAIVCALLDLRGVSV